MAKIFTGKCRECRIMFVQRVKRGNGSDFCPECRAMGEGKRREIREKEARECAFDNRVNYMEISCLDEIDRMVKKAKRRYWKNSRWMKDLARCSTSRPEDSGTPKSP